jgi:hypothetical protein
MGMEYKQAQDVVKQVGEQLKEQADVSKAFGEFTTALYKEKTGFATVAADTAQKIDGVPASYAMQLAAQLKEIIEKIPGLYEAAKKFMPKGVSKALKTLITKDVVEPALIAKDAYNARVKTYKFQQDANATMKSLSSVKYGI